MRRSDVSLAVLAVVLVLVSAVGVQWFLDSAADRLQAGGPVSLGVRVYVAAASPAVVVAIALAIACIAALAMGQHSVARALSRVACYAAMIWALGSIVVLGLANSALDCKV